MGGDAASVNLVQLVQRCTHLKTADRPPSTLTVHEERSACTRRHTAPLLQRNYRSIWVRAAWHEFCTGFRSVVFFYLKGSSHETSSSVSSCRWCQPCRPELGGRPKRFLAHQGPCALDRPISSWRSGGYRLTLDGASPVAGPGANRGGGKQGGCRRIDWHRVCVASTR